MIAAGALWLLAALCLLLDAPGWAMGLLVLPAVFWAPGWGWARWLHARKGGDAALLQLVVDATWLSIAQVVVAGCLVRELSLPAWVLLASVVTTGLPGLVLAWKRRAAPVVFPSRRALLGVGVVLLGVLWVANQHAPSLVRPMDAYWWHAAPDQAAWDRTPVESEAFEALGWPEAGAMKATLEAGEFEIFVPQGGQLLAAARGAVGTTLSLSQAGAVLDRALVESDPVVREEEGPVPRYLDRGVTAVVAELASGSATVILDAPATVYLVPSQDAVWALDELGELRFVHYYQCLNIVENQRWAAATLEDLRATVNQPPLWAYQLAVPTALIDKDLKGAALLYLWVLVFAGLSGVRLLELAGPRADWPAWILPALATMVHGRLMIEPGSFNFPDSLYAVALVGGMAALLGPRLVRTGLVGLAASMLRYPGAVVIGGAAVLKALLEGRLRALAKPTLYVAGAGVALAALVALAGLVSGNLGEWLHILWFETFPEHWHGEGDPRVLLSRTPRFYQMWVVYAGGAPLLAIIGARGRSLLILLTAAGYSLLLCTIDHFPSHYFLPLVHLSAIALAAGVGTLPDRIPRWLVLGLGIVGLTWSALFGIAM